MSEIVIMLLCLAFGGFVGAMAAGAIQGSIDHLSAIKRLRGRRADILGVVLAIIAGLLFDFFQGYAILDADVQPTLQRETAGLVGYIIVPLVWTLLMHRHNSRS